MGAVFFWLREVAGWVLAGSGLYLVWMGVAVLQNYEVEPRMIEGSAICFSGIMVLRVGVQLIRVSTAARIVAAATRARTDGGKAGTGSGSATN